MKFKYYILILLIIIYTFLLTGCYDASGMETLGYVTAMGIDKGEINNIKLTLHFATLNNSSGSETKSSQNTDTSSTSVECNTIDAGINLINAYISKKVNLSHCKAIIFSEELAKAGIGDQIFTLVNNIEVRPDCNIIISKCNSADFLKNLKPDIEASSSKYFELILNSSEYTGYLEDITLSDFCTSLLSTTGESIAILSGINAQTAVDSLSENYKASETPIVSSNSVECMGLAVFKGDVLVGELDNIQTLCHMIVSNKLKRAIITIPSSTDLNSYISLNVQCSKPTNNTVEIINGTPYITSNVYVSAKVMSFDKNLDLSDKTTITKLEKNLSDYLEKNISDYLYATSQEYKSDIDNFGKYMLSKYLTWSDWENSNWLTNYRNSFFSISVESNIESGYLYDKF